MPETVVTEGSGGVMRRRSVNTDGRGSTRLSIGTGELEHVLQTLSVLSLHDLFEEDPTQVVHEFIVSQTMATITLASHHLTDIRQGIEEIFTVSLSENEVIEALNGLVGGGKAHKVSEDTWELTPLTYESIVESLAEKRQAKEEVIDEWREMIIGKHGYGLKTSELDLLQRDLETYTVRLFERHGLECTRLLYCGEPEIHGFIEASKEYLLRALPSHNPRVDRIRAYEIPAFFERATPKRKTYIAELLDATFLHYQLMVDKKVDRIVQHELQGKTLYIDTNVIYRLLGFHGKGTRSAISELIELSKHFGVSLKVAEATLAEYRRAWREDIKDLEKYPTFSKKAARIAAELLATNDFATGYLRRYAETGETLDFFRSMYSHITSFLEDAGVQRDDIPMEEIEADGHPDKETREILDFVESWPRRFPKMPRYRKLPPVAHHDAHLRCLVEQVRGGPVISFGDAKAWVLTCDQGLVLYERQADPYNKLFSFIMPHEWLQLLRPFRNRNIGFNHSLADSLSSPFLRSFPGFRTGGRKFASKVVEAVDAARYLADTEKPALAVRLSANIALQRRLEAIGGETARDEVLDQEVRKLAADVKKRQREELLKLREKNRWLLDRVEEQRENLKQEVSERERIVKNFPRLYSEYVVVPLTLGIAAAGILALCAGTIISFFLGYRILHPLTASIGIVVSVGWLYLSDRKNRVWRKDILRDFRELAEKKRGAYE